MIHPTRTNLLHLKERRGAVTNSARILKARRQALIRKVLESSRSFLESNEAIRSDYRKALAELQFTLGHEGRDFVESVAASGRRDVGVEIEQKNVMGVKYREISFDETMVRSPQERHYDYMGTTPHMEEAIHLFEKIVDAMMQYAVFESKLKRLGDEILRVTRRNRVLEERVLPRLKGEIRRIGQYLGERERESYFRLKRFKDKRTARALSECGRL
ncbi:MAG: V-type ATP synthase subunit D [bacterium]|nr:V-type ATP synthase subunit D [bacterium]